LSEQKENQRNIQVTNRDRVVVLARYRGRGKGSGVDVEATGAHLWVMRDGKAESLMVFSDRNKALTAAELPPR
jgi:hypothetical protein